MTTPRLEAIDRTQMALERTAWEQPRRRPAAPGDRRKNGPRQRLVESALPGTDPETCEVDMVLDADGIFIAIVIRSLDSGEELKRLSTADLAAIGGHSGASGLLVERRG
ncbi:MAG: hypothetical protein C0506_12430 [Anaerolinea sp.]|nr:hypothetical protein [Anaerolinea sp.]